MRIALHLLGIGFDCREVDLITGGGEQHAAGYLAINPQARVPALVLDDGTVLIQSPAILEYLAETTALPALLPHEPIARARVRGLAALIACDIHPLNNTSVLSYLRGDLGADDAAIAKWYLHWIAAGFAAFEQMITPAPFCGGDAPGLADVMLVPQIANARRFSMDFSAYPKIMAVEAACAAHPAFVAAHPDRYAPSA